MVILERMRAVRAEERLYLRLVESSAAVYERPSFHALEEWTMSVIGPYLFGQPRSVEVAAYYCGSPCEQLLHFIHDVIQVREHARLDYGRVDACHIDLTDAINLRNGSSYPLWILTELHLAQVDAACVYGCAPALFTDILEYQVFVGQELGWLHLLQERDRRLQVGPQVVPSHLVMSSEHPEPHVPSQHAHHTDLQALIRSVERDDQHFHDGAPL